MSSLSKKCRNCKYNRIQKYKLVDLLVLDFLKINNKILRLEQIEDKAAKAKEAAIAALQAARAKLNQVRKQKKFLKRYKQQQFNASAQFIKDIKQLEQQEAVLDNITTLKNRLMPSLLALNQLTYPPPLDPNAVNTSATTVSSL